MKTKTLSTLFMSTIMLMFSCNSTKNNPSSNEQTDSLAQETDVTEKCDTTYFLYDNYYYGDTHHEARKDAVIMLIRSHKEAKGYFFAPYMQFEEMGESGHSWGYTVCKMEDITYTDKEDFELNFSVKPDVNKFCNVPISVDYTSFEDARKAGYQLWDITPESLNKLTIEAKYKGGKLTVVSSLYPEGTIFHEDIYIEKSRAELDKEYFDYRKVDDEMRSAVKNIYTSHKDALYSDASIDKYLSKDFKEFMTKVRTQADGDNHLENLNRFKYIWLMSDHAENVKWNITYSFVGSKTDGYVDVYVTNGGKKQRVQLMMRKENNAWTVYNIAHEIPVEEAMNDIDVLYYFKRYLEEDMGIKSDYRDNPYI